MPAYMSCPNSLLPREKSDRPDLSREAIASQELSSRAYVLDAACNGLMLIVKVA